MKLAVDHTDTASDEADHSDEALLAAVHKRRWGVNTQKRKHDDAFAATHVHGGCLVCGKCGHTKAECFAPGGGLHHLTYQQQQEWLQKRRQQRAQERAQQQPAQGTAMATNDQQKTLSVQEATIQALSAQVRVQELQIKDAADRGYSPSSSTGEMNF